MVWFMGVRPLCYICVCLFFHIAVGGICDGQSFTIEDDANLNSIIAQAREEFLQSRPTPVSVLDVALLLPSTSNGNTIWKRGTYRGLELGYPASCVKLAYMAASVKWCQDNGRPSNCLDQHVRPMVKNSDNLQTGVVVDICSGAPNLNITSTTDPLFTPWYEKRLWAMNFLSEHNLLGNQTVNVKTYPTNTGQTLWGAEYLSWDTFGRNEMCAKCAASLILEVTQGGLYGIPTKNPDLYGGPTGYMRGLLNHQMWSGESSFGFGVPPGTVLYNKIGVAYDNLNDIALIKLPSGVEFILAVFSTGYEASQPYPYDGSNLGTFLYFLLEKLDVLSASCSPPIFTYFTNSTNFQSTGEWSSKTAHDALGGSYMSTTDANASASWSVDIPSDGLYEVAIWSPQSKSFSSGASITVTSVNGPYMYSISQQSYGGRWYKLGDFYFIAGKQNLLSIAGPTDSSLSVVANAVKISKWPQCHDSPAATCQDFDPLGPTCNSLSQ